MASARGRRERRSGLGRERRGGAVRALRAGLWEACGRPGRGEDQTPERTFVVVSFRGAVPNQPSQDVPREDHMDRVPIQVDVIACREPAPGSQCTQRRKGAVLEHTGTASRDDELRSAGLLTAAAI